MSDAPLRKPVIITGVYDPGTIRILKERIGARVVGYTSGFKMRKHNLENPSLVVRKHAEWSVFAECITLCDALIKATSRSAAAVQLGFWVQNGEIPVPHLV